MRRRGQFGTRWLRGRWTAAVQRVALALLLAFTSLLPAAAETGPHTLPATVLSLAATTSTPAAEVDLCLVCHHHCACHQAAVVERAAELLPRLAQTTVFRRESWQTRSIVTERPRKPPRVVS